MKTTLIALLLLARVAFGQTPPTHSATLTWQDALNPAGTTYNPYRATGLCSGTPVFSKLASGITVKTYVDATVTPGNYCYEVTADFMGMESAPSNMAPAAIPSFPPTGLTVTTAEVRIPSAFDRLLLIPEMGSQDVIL